MLRLPGRLQRNIQPEPNSGCWLWTASTNQKGYGRTELTGRSMLAHRAVWISLVGPIPAGMQLDHRCRVRCCVNPDHLRVVTPRENTNAPGSLHLGLLARNQKSCKRGHPLDGTNLYIRKSEGHRGCRVCRRDAWKKYFALNRDKRNARRRRRRALPDGPAGATLLRCRASQKATNSAATVTQAGGVECALPAFSHFAQGHAGRPGWTQRPASLRGLHVLVGGARVWARVGLS